MDNDVSGKYGCIMSGFHNTTGYVEMKRSEGAKKKQIAEQEVRLAELDLENAGMRMLVAVNLACSGID